jgi:cytochrome c556
MTYFKTGIVLVFVLVTGIISANAKDDPIATRKALMKTVGASIKASVPMVRGKIPFDAVKAELAMRAINAVATGIGSFYPDGTQTGGKTSASPKIWSDRAGYTALRKELIVASAAAIVAAKAGEGPFKAAFGKVGAMCKKCHKAYRVKK